MSIVALKRNSRRFLVPVSANGFSLNGGYRNQRLIGNTNLSALYSGNYNICSGNDPSIIKPSTKNTKGYIYSTVLYPTCDNGNCVSGTGNNKSITGANIVKDFSPESKSQGVYIIDQIKAGSSTCVTNKSNSGTPNDCLPDCKARSYFIGGRKVYTTYNAKNSGTYGQGAISAGEYLSAGLLKNNCLPAPVKPVLNNSGCYHC